MFGLFKSKKEIIIKDIVWKNETIKYKWIVDKIKTLNKVVLIYFFEDTKSEMIEALSNNSFTEHITGSEKIAITPANTILKSLSLHDRTPIFIEHFPSYKAEQEILNYLLNNLSIKEITFYVSLEDELLKHFGSERIVQMLEKMGFQDDEALEHNMISKSILNAQKKIDEQVKFGTNTRNSKDWFKMNLNL